MEQFADLTYEIIGAAMEVHRTIGPGLPEKVYEVAMLYELELRDVQVATQHHVSVSYKGRLAGEFFLDLVVDDKVIVELKALHELLPVHRSQLITYLKASYYKIGLLINFGQPSLAFERIYPPTHE